MSALHPLPLSVLTSSYSKLQPASVAPIGLREFNRAKNDRRKTWELPNRRKDWGRRGGDSLQGDRHQTGTRGRRQGFTAGNNSERSQPQTVRAGSAAGVGAWSPE